jgi:ParB/RepB/Spo0J family partition protein
MELEFQQLDRRYEALRRRSPERERRLVSSLAEHGQQLPIVVVAGESGQHVVVDGYKRVRALRTLRRDTVIATAWELSEDAALVLERLMRASDQDDALEQAWLLRELRERFDLSELELAKRFDKSKSWVSRRLALLSELPEAIQDQVRAGTLGAHAAGKYLVPLARANMAECLTLVKALSTGKPTNRQVRSLYDALVSGGDGERALVLNDPWLFLRVKAEAARAGEKQRTPAEVLLGEMGAMAGIARRTNKRLSELAQRLGKDERETVRRALALVKAEAMALFLRGAKEFGDAGSEAAHGNPAAA